MTLASYENARDALAYISPDIDREDWAKIGMSLKDGLNGNGFELFDEWSKTGQSYNKDDVEDTWKSIKADGGVTVGTLFYLAGQNGWKPNGTVEPETEEQRLKRESERKAKADKEAKSKEAKAKAAIEKVKALCEQATPAKIDHPYLVRKGVKTLSLLELPAENIKRILGYAPKSDGKPLEGRILIAQVEIDGNLSTAELIDENGRKSAIAGGIKSNGYWSAQPLPIEDKPTTTFVIAEGIATILTVQEAISKNLQNNSVFYCLAALSAGNFHKLAKSIRTKYPSSEILIIADVGNGRIKAIEAAHAVKGTAITPDLSGFNATESDTDFNDLHRLAGLDEVISQIEAGKKQSKSLQTAPQLERSKQADKNGKNKKIDFDEPIYDFPHVTESGRKRATIANLRYLFESYGIEVSYDELLKKQTIKFNNTHDKGHGDLIDNAGVAHIRSLMALNGMPAMSLDLLPALFAEKASNTILTWIESKKWDGKDRFNALSSTLTVAENDTRYRDVALFTWLIQCVAAADGAKRTTNKDAIPKFELAFILQGGQGVKKTSWFKRLLPRNLSVYIVDGAYLDPADKETVRTCISSWICELGELDSTFRRADISRLKAFLSKQTDTLRLPYDRAESQFGRRTSFCGSVNPEQFLNDSTGSRRFLPLQVTACDSLHIIDMQQLWAQIWSYYLNGYQWWCGAELEEMLKERHERHSETVPIDELIAETFNVEKIEKSFDHKHFTATRILIECGIKEPKASQASIVNSFIKKCGFKQVQNEGVRGYWLEKRQFKAW